MFKSHGIDWLKTGQMYELGLAVWTNMLRHAETPRASMGTLWGGSLGRYSVGSGP